jgi:hypothetical protein
LTLGDDQPVETDPFLSFANLFGDPRRLADENVRAVVERPPCEPNPLADGLFLGVRLAVAAKNDCRVTTRFVTGWG